MSRFSESLPPTKGLPVGEPINFEMAPGVLCRLTETTLGWWPEVWVTSQPADGPTTWAWFQSATGAPWFSEALAAAFRWASVGTGQPMMDSGSSGNGVQGT